MYTWVIPVNYQINKYLSALIKNVEFARRCCTMKIVFINQKQIVKILYVSIKKQNV